MWLGIVCLGVFFKVGGFGKFLNFEGMMVCVVCYYCFVKRKLFFRSLKYMLIVFFFVEWILFKVVLEVFLMIFFS